MIALNILGALALAFAAMTANHDIAQTRGDHDAEREAVNVTAQTPPRSNPFLDGDTI